MLIICRLRSHATNLLIGWGDEMIPNSKFSQSSEHLDKLFRHPISELSDQQVLDLLDFVSDEIKRRNDNISPSNLNGDSVKRATEFISELIQQVVNK
jgi:hypothetical protein